MVKALVFGTKDLCVRIVGIIFVNDYCPSNIFEGTVVDSCFCVFFLLLQHIQD